MLKEGHSSSNRAESLIKNYFDLEKNVKFVGFCFDKEG